MPAPPVPPTPSDLPQPPQTANENNLIQGYRQNQHPTANINNSNTASLPAGTGSLNPAGMADSVYRPASVINLSNSNDVVIGPMTQYQGAVTIYQYMDATVETSNRRAPVSLGKSLLCVVGLTKNFYL